MSRLRIIPLTLPHPPPTHCVICGHTWSVICGLLLYLPQKPPPLESMVWVSRLWCWAGGCLQRNVGRNKWSELNDLIGPIDFNSRRHYSGDSRAPPVTRKTVGFLEPFLTPNRSVWCLRYTELRHCPVNHKYSEGFQHTRSAPTPRRGLFTGLIEMTQPTLTSNKNPATALSDNNLSNCSPDRPQSPAVLAVRPAQFLPLTVGFCYSLLPCY
ncbi:hypothetical protein J6590_012521 [Homalodisca vitripennis]|nr:hypothetical protein J6590_012521 [Homalodisca vitripennis]